MIKSEIISEAGSVLLLAVAEKSGLLEKLSQALCELQVGSPHRTESLLKTLLFLPVVGLSRPYDLRHYSGDGLRVLSGSRCEYSYIHVERFLARLTTAGGEDVITNAVGSWTSQLWSHDDETIYYVDGHHKPVYSHVRIPRGLIGRTGKVLGSRALTLLHDDAGHPLLVRTDRGDLPLTKSLPHVVDDFAGHHTFANQPRIVVDRECMAAEFLHQYAATYTVITLLKTTQYQDLSSFQSVSDFVPLSYDHQGQVTQDLASAMFALAVPNQDKPLMLSVALIRDHQRHHTVDPTSDQREAHWQTHRSHWMYSDWYPTPVPAGTTSPKLIPIVSTQPVTDPQQLVNWYRHRWQAQENVIKDFLLPLGLDANHGYAKSPVENSEIAKPKQTLTNRIQRLDRWRTSALQRSQNARQRARNLQRRVHDLIDQYTQYINRPQPHDLMPPTIPHQMTIDAYQRQQYQRIRKLMNTSDRDFNKAQLYAQQLCQVHRDLLDLNQRDRPMFELDNRKDQLMSALKVALTNLVMWTRDHLFPESYIHATWKRLQPFFNLPGQLQITTTHCIVHLKSFRPLDLQRDLKQLCETVNLAHLYLPDGRILQFHIDQHL